MNLESDQPIARDTGTPPGGWRPSVLVLDDEWTTLERIRTSLGDDFEVVTASRAQQAQEHIASRVFDVVLTDLRMPEMDGLTLVREMKARYPDNQYILMTGYGNIEDSIRAIRLGVADYLRKPLTMSEVRRALNRCLEQRRLRREVATLHAVSGQSLSDIITRSKRMEELLRQAETVAATDATVLVNGETGTGKELLARAIHNASSRASQSFVKINCAAIPATLIESELFGHERGSFTGAHARKLGRVEMANKGTLLLDEVGEMPLDMQAKLLRFLQELSFERVGGTNKLKADVRIIAATNRDLKQEVAQGPFPLGPALPPGRGAHETASPAPARRGHPPAGRFFPAAHRPEVRQAGQRLRAPGPRSAVGLPLAGQRARAGARRGASGDLVPLQPATAPGPGRRRARRPRPRPTPAPDAAASPHL